MRKRYGLPGYGWCWGNPNVTYLVQWIFCNVCSLCQEVFTEDFYEFNDYKLYPRQYLNQYSQE